MFEEETEREIIFIHEGLNAFFDSSPWSYEELDERLGLERGSTADCLLGEALEDLPLGDFVALLLHLGRTPRDLYPVVHLFQKKHPETSYGQLLEGFFRRTNESSEKRMTRAKRQRLAARDRSLHTAWFELLESQDRVMDHFIEFMATLCPDLDAKIKLETRHASSELSEALERFETRVGRFQRKLFAAQGEEDAAAR